MSVYPCPGWMPSIVLAVHKAAAMWRLALRSCHSVRRGHKMYAPMHREGKTRLLLQPLPPSAEAAVLLVGGGTLHEAPTLVF